MVRRLQIVLERTVSLRRLTHPRIIFLSTTVRWNTFDLLRMDTLRFVSSKVTLPIMTSKSEKESKETLHGPIHTCTTTTTSVSRTLSPSIPQGKYTLRPHSNFSTDLPPDNSDDKQDGRVLCQRRKSYTASRPILRRVDHKEDQRTIQRRTKHPWLVVASILRTKPRHLCYSEEIKRL